MTQAQLCALALCDSGQVLSARYAKHTSNDIYCQQAIALRVALGFPELLQRDNYIKSVIQMQFNTVAKGLCPTYCCQAPLTRKLCTCKIAAAKRACFPRPSAHHRAPKCCLHAQEDDKQVCDGLCRCAIQRKEFFRESASWLISLTKPGSC